MRLAPFHRSSFGTTFLLTGQPLPGLFDDDKAGHRIVALSALDRAVEFVAARLVELDFLRFVVLERNVQVADFDAVSALRIFQRKLERIARLDANFRRLELPVAGLDRDLVDGSRSAFRGRRRTGGGRRSVVGVVPSARSERKQSRKRAYGDDSSGRVHL